MSSYHIQKHQGKEIDNDNTNNTDNNDNKSYWLY